MPRNTIFGSAGEISGRISIKQNISGSLQGGATLSGDLSVPVSSTIDYDDLRNKPSIENITLQGDKSFPELGISPIDSDDLIEILS